jgi:zinc/manganese transport system substrate-binding protein
MRHPIAIAAVLAATLSATAAEAALNVFACLPEWGALASELGGDKVSVYTASTAKQDPHRLEARPSLIARMRSAEIAVCSGADLEIGWLPVLIRTAGNDKVQAGQPGYFMAAELVPRLEVPARIDRAQGDVHPYGNPHVHLDPRNIQRIGRALAERLAQVDPANSAYYQSRWTDFDTRWRTATAAWEAKAVPLRGMKVVPYHRDSSYLINWLGLVEVTTIESKPGVPPSAGQLATLLNRLQAEPASAITVGAYTDPKAAEWLSERTGTPVVTLPYTVGGTPRAKDLFTLFDDTLDRLLAARK